MATNWLFFILLVTSISSVSACPNGCRCYRLEVHQYGQPVYNVDCGGLGLSAVPDNLPLETTDLSLVGNKLTDIEWGTLDRLKKLRVIYLNNNKFTTLKGNSIAILKDKKLDGMDISGNPLDCSCDNIEPLVHWLSQVKGPKQTGYWMALINSYNTKCSSPPELKGRTIHTLKFADLKC